jgi:hypothetical protein
MPPPSGLVLNQVTVEVQYDRGIVYLDKCGSLNLSLQDALGRPFKGSNIPTMQFGEVASVAERVTVRYGPASTSVTQSWVRAPARVEQIAPVVWEHVSNALRVADHVHRCEVRFLMAWKTNSLREGIEKIERWQVFQPDDWAALFGGPSKCIAWVGVAEDEFARMRVALDTFQVTHEAELPPELAALVPTSAILLDVGHVHAKSRMGPDDQTVFTLQKAQLKDFVRTSWQRARTIAAKIGGRLGVERGGAEQPNEP